MNEPFSLSDPSQPGFCRVNAVTQYDTPGSDTLMEWLRDTAGYVDVRQGCDTGHCGACAVLVNGVAVKSCSVMAREVNDLDVHTLSGLALLEQRPVQAVLQATQQQQPFQCGYCVPAFVIAAITLLQHKPQPSEVEVRDAFAGLLCRCTGYQSIVDMVLLAARLLRDS